MPKNFALFADFFCGIRGQSLLAVYVRGLLSDIGRKNVETMARKQDVAPPTLQRLLETIKWDHQEVLRRCRRIIAAEHSWNRQHGGRGNHRQDTVRQATRRWLPQQRLLQNSNFFLLRWTGFTPTLNRDGPSSRVIGLSSVETAIARRMKATKSKTSDAKSLRKRIAALEKNIAKGVERPLLLDDDHLDDASRLLADWRGERRRLNEQLQATGRGRQSNPKREAARVTAELGRSRENFHPVRPRDATGRAGDRDRRCHALRDRRWTTQMEVPTRRKPPRWARALTG
ncbi:hypothetical protein CA13_10300 [Planctomycetes bacterium CA13]|uniref:Transposase IS701-like DDE domain-containing protein n=1 Tax=Novipirellula herctigrandis TaxID=2527986 RepID=A0A5C5YY26_9BACT|nr:hypothetical protein CA13_10300 [Planctomycetes bacterium CA13]